MFGWIFAPAVSKSKGLPKRVRENCASSSPKSGKNNLMVCICFKHGVFLRVQRGGKYAGPKWWTVRILLELLENNLFLRLSEADNNPSN